MLPPNGKTMVEFGTDYWHAMDKDKVEKIVISPKELGFAAGIGDPWANIQSHIKAGASHVELGFMGMGKGSISQPMSVTPESITKEKREDIRHLAKLNNVTLSTHASANAMGFAGLGERGFSDQIAQRNITEVKKAVDFAADTAEGGVVVIHTGEFQRNITEAGLTDAERRQGKLSLFESYPEEHKKGQVHLVNTETGEIIGGISKNLKISEPDLDKNDKPKFDKDGHMLFKEGYDFEKYTKEHKHDIEKAKIPAEEYFYRGIIEKKRKQTIAEEGRWKDNMERAMRAKEELEEEQKNLYEKAKENEKRAHFKAMQLIEAQGLAPLKSSPEYDAYQKDPIKFIDKLKDKTEHEIRYAQSGFEGHARELKDLDKQEKTVKTVNEFAIEKTAQNIAKLGVYAYEVEKARKLKNPLVIAPENIFAEQYGSHPQELRHIVIESRKMMTEQLTKQVGRKEAEKIASERIKATFDIGHANTWKKYFKEKDPTGEKFKEWVLKEAKQLQKEGIIGNVHLADNFGYEDEHLTPGQGNAPIEEFVKNMKAEGYTGKFVVEPGGQTDQEGGIYTAMTGAWGHLANSPIYRVGKFAQSWTDVSGGYLGQTWTPRHVSGTYLPSKESWGWYSETPIE